jgi:hypothetical protein
MPTLCHSTEYLISPTLLEKLATKHGFRLLLNKSFGDFVADTMQIQEGAKEKLLRMHGVDAKGTVSQVEWDISHLYSVLAFESVAPPPPMPKPNVGTALTHLKQFVPGYEHMSPEPKQKLLNEKLAQMTRTWKEANSED